MKKKPSGLVLSIFRFILWGWIPVLRNLLWFRSLDRKARKYLSSSEPSKRGMGRSIVMFMCEHIFWELSYLHRRGGWLANRHIELIDFAAETAIAKNDVDKKSIEYWKTRCYETIGFVGPNRGFNLPSKKPKTEPIVINETIVA